jgi:hypothetical protein
MRKFLFVFLALHFLSSVASGFDLKGAQPIPPYGVFSTFSADTLSRGASAVSFGAERSKGPGFYRFTAQYGHGLTESIEADITVPYSTGWKDGIDGFEDVAFSLRHRFFDERRYGPAIAYIITASLPTGREDFSTEGSYGAGLIISKKVGPVNGHANLFYSRPGTQKFKDDITFSAGLDFAAASNFSFLGEIYGKKSYSGSLDRLETRIGYRIMTRENILTTVGLGFDIKRRSPEYRAFVSLTYLFHRNARKSPRVIESED